MTLMNKKYAPVIPCAHFSVNETNSAWVFLNPVILLSAIVSISITLWAITPPRIVFALVPQGRYISPTSFGYLAMCILMFFFGHVLAELELRHNPPNNRTRLISSMLCNESQKEYALAVFRIAAGCLLILALTGYLVMLIKGFASYGSVFGYIKEVYSGSQIGKLKREFAHARVSGLTTFVFFTQSSAILGYLGLRIAQRHKLRKYKRSFWIIILLSLFPGLFSLLVIGGIRSQLLHVLIPLLIIHVCFTVHHTGTARPIMKYSIISIIVILAAFSAGFYIRNYLPAQSGHNSVARLFHSKSSVFSGALDNLSSYFFRSLNNCFVLVDNFDQHTFFYRTFNWFYTGFGLKNIDPGGLIRAAENQMGILQDQGIAFFSASNSTMFGYYFIDLGWAAVGIFLILGYIFGKLYLGLTDYSLLSWLLYPSLIYGLSDCWRTAVLTKTPGMLPVFGLIAAYSYIRTKLPEYA